MNTNINVLKGSFLVLVFLLVVSCGKQYRMLTTLEKDGRAMREIYAEGDSAFMAGDIFKSPFLFDIDKGWSITRFDTPIKYNFFGSEEKANIKVSKSATSIDQFSKEMDFSDNKKEYYPLAAPVESLSKKIGWFYTTYELMVLYKKIQYNVPVPIDNYMTKEEQRIWTQGDFSNYKALNGIEINNFLNECEAKLMKWTTRNTFEISLNIIKRMANGYDSLEIDKEKIFNQILKKNDGYNEINPDTVCNALNKFYGTRYFTELIKSNKDVINAEFEKSFFLTTLIGVEIKYELAIPGEILNTNAPLINSNILSWKVDGMRILFEEQALTAEYRVVNKWAFVLTGLVIVTAMGSLFFLLKKKFN